MNSPSLGFFVGLFGLGTLLTQWDLGLFVLLVICLLILFATAGKAYARVPAVRKDPIKEALFELENKEDETSHLYDLD